MGDVLGKRIYHTVKGSKPGTTYNMEYNILLGWMCSCKSYMYRRSCRHIIEMNELMMENGACTKCINYYKEQDKDMCKLWELELKDADIYTCAGWEEKKDDE